MARNVRPHNQTGRGWDSNPRTQGLITRHRRLSRQGHGGSCSFLGSHKRGWAWQSSIRWKTISLIHSIFLNTSRIRTLAVGERLNEQLFPLLYTFHGDHSSVFETCSGLCTSRRENFNINLNMLYTLFLACYGHVSLPCGHAITWTTSLHVDRMLLNMKTKALQPAAQL